MTEPVRPPRRRLAEIHIPLTRREDRVGGDIYVGVGAEAGIGVDLADFIVLVLTGREGGPGPTLVLRPRADGDTTAP